jgi:hypothetical protein
MPSPCGFSYPDGFADDRVRIRSTGITYGPRGSTIEALLEGSLLKSWAGRPSVFGAEISRPDALSMIKVGSRRPCTRTLGRMGSAQRHCTGIGLDVTARTESPRFHGLAASDDGVDPVQPSASRNDLFEAYAWFTPKESHSFK